jgi:hypothetical protein
MRKLVIPAGKRISSAMDGKFKLLQEAWIRFAVFGSGTNLSGTDLH